MTTSNPLVMRHSAPSTMVALLTMFLATGLGTRGALADGSGHADVLQNVQCMQHYFGSNPLNCTANDVQLAEATRIVIFDECSLPGDTASFSADFRIVLTAQERYDIGIWWSEDGDPNGDGSVSGLCTVATPPYGPDPPWIDLDQAVDGQQGDTCGDINDAHNPLFPNVTFANIVCADPDGDGKLNLPYCTSWRQPGSNDLCLSPVDAFPGAPSKCFCDKGFNIDIPVPYAGTINVIKNLSPTTDIGRFDLQVDDTDKKTNAGHLDQTGPVIVDAGFSTDPAPIGKNHTVREKAHSGTSLSDYDTTYSCSDGGAPVTGSGSEPVQLFVENKDAWVCTFTNTRRPAHLTLVKRVINDNGGTAVAGNWMLQASGPTTLSGAGGATGDVPPGTYALSESAGPAGYTAGSWSCVGGIQSGSDIKLESNQNATCTIVNDDRPAHLRLVKTVTNDNGGTAAATDFTLSASGPTPLSGTSGVEGDVSSGTYSLSETGPAGYSASEWSCVGGSQSGSQVTLALGESATCTITNDDRPPSLTLTKVVVNDNGGTAVTTDFTLSANGPTPISGAGGATSGAGFAAGSYALSETGPAGYSASEWSCVGGSQSGSQVTLALGESATCTITNDDRPPSLTLTKVVVNDNGGTAVAADFTLSASGPTPISGAGGATSGAGFAAGSYALSEAGLAGYSASEWSCVGGSQSGSQVTLALGESATCTITNDDRPPVLTLAKVVVNDNGGTAVAADFTLIATGYVKASPAAGTFKLSEAAGPLGYALTSLTCDNATGQVTSVTLGLGEHVTCTFINDDIAPKLHLRKVVINDNGGTKTASAFTLKADGTGSNDLEDKSPVDSGAGLKADTWVLSETSVYGYTASAWSCVGGTQAGSSITVGLGQEATCTITNDDQPGTITVRKISKPADTGSFAFTTTGTGYSGFTLPGGGQNSQSLNAGTYTVQEGTQLGWILTGIGGSTNVSTPYDCVVTGSGGSTGVGDLGTQTATISLKNGDTVTCTFENTGQGVTRTQGFWATHSRLADIAWNGGSAFGHTFPGVAGTTGIGDTTICGRTLTTGQVMGGFWSDISKTTAGVKRSSLDQSRMRLLQQMLAAELNASAFGSLPGGGSGQFAAWEAAYCGTDQTAISNAQQGAASFNSAGDSGLFTPGTSADSKNARAIADKAFWDILRDDGLMGELSIS